MSVYALEQALWEIGRDAAVAGNFREMPESLLARYRLTDDERTMLRGFDVRAMAEREVSTLLLMMAWLAVQGPGSVPQYMERMNAPHQ